ncbi:hypothetical protein JZ785_27590 (plasmid) [Alicyclobacillus curvatus]|nr:hypothetical protein JZ785_27590 [Alicyclobacillus curvatus]
MMADNEVLTFENMINQLFQETGITPGQLTQLLVVYYSNAEKQEEIARERSKELRKARRRCQTHLKKLARKDIRPTCLCGTHNDDYIAAICGQYTSEFPYGKYHVPENVPAKVGP